MQSIMCKSDFTYIYGYFLIIRPQILNMLKNQRGDPWKSKIFLFRGVYEMGWRGVRSLLKPSSTFLTNKTKILKSAGG